MGSCSKREQEIVENILFRQRDDAHGSQGEEKSKSEVWEALKEEIYGEKRRSRIVRIRWISAAAAIITIFLSAILYIANNQMDVNNAGISRLDVPPAANHATLTFSDGRSVSLKEEETGILVSDGISYQDGTSVFEQKDSISTMLSQTIQLITPKGGTYQVQLSDGTKIRLNANSSLTYPIHFLEGEERVVYLEGEAYFDVEHNASLRKATGGVTPEPFKVVTKEQTVEVLGTEFNINAYLDESYVKTTLLKGAVRVSPTHAPDDSRILKPGEQSKVQGKNIEIARTDLDEVAAWTNGEFVFYQKDLRSIMSEIARWYNVDVIYETPVQNIAIWGSISRFKNLSEVLAMIEMTGSVHFKIVSDANGSGRRVYVIK